MSWRTVIAVLIFVFAVIFMQSVFAGPLFQFGNDLAAQDDDDGNSLDSSAKIENLETVWFDMGIIAVMGIGVWGLARVVRRELTRGGGGGF